MGNNHQSICCLNPQCPNPDNDFTVNFCIHCGQPIVKALRQRYRPIKLLSDQGGFGRTYLATDDDRLNQLCVIKQFAPQVNGSSGLKKAQELFEQEALQLQQIGEHQQIPSLLAYFQEENYLYLIQQYIPGITLEEELNQRKKPYNETEIRQFLGDILPVLKFIHDQDLIHRDLKPANIMRLTQDISQLGGNKGQYVLIDFGASKDLQNTVVKTGTRIGTNGYSPKEQLLEGKADSSSDLYSLGAVCFYLLTAIDPFTLFVDNGYGWVKDWRSHLTISITPELTTILSKLLEVKTEDRFSTVEEVLQYLNKEKSPQNLKSQPIKTVIQSLKIDKNQSLSKHHTKVINYELVKTLTGHQDSVNSVVISPDGGTVVSGSDDKTIKIWDLNTGDLKQTLTNHKSSVYSVAISPDCNTVVSGSEDKTIKIWDLNTGDLKQTLTGRKSSVYSVVISPDCNTVISGSSDKTIKIWDLNTGDLKQTLTGHQDSVWSVAISSDNDTIVSGNNDKTIKIWDLNTGELKRTLTGHQYSVWSVAISPDGGTVVSGSSDNTIKIWSLKTGQLKQTLTGHNSYVNSVAISPDNHIIVSGSSDNTIKIWDLNTGELKETLTGHQSRVKSVAISPDGGTLVSGSRDKTIKIWQLR
jgi:WD40 repeat protein